MQINPQSIHLLDTTHLKTQKLSTSTPYHHGQPDPNSRDTAHRSPSRGVPPLLEIPSESLTHITSFLDSGALFALSRTSKLLHEHVSDDNTWHRAFFCQFLGEGSEDGSLDTPLLRCTEESWKKEFVLRCNLLRRWERSRNGTVSHMPHYSPIVSMHLLTDQSHGPALLTASLQYGIVARSLPLSGKVLKGFLGAAADGIGIGNPNVEFTPNVSACGIASEGWTAKVVWGYASGEIALTSGNKVMDAGRTASKVVRCQVADQHRGKVADVVWDLGGAAFATAGVDGIVRIWDAKRMRCVWILRDHESMVPDACVHVKTDLARGIVLATKESGTVVIWEMTGVLLDLPADAESNGTLPKLRILSPHSSLKRPKTVFTDPGATGSSLAFGILFEDDQSFYRANVDLSSCHYEYIHFTGGPLGPLHTLHPFFKVKEGESTVIIAGDQLGRVSFFNWSASPLLAEDGTYAVSSFRRLDAHDDCAVTALACNALLLATGSDRGITKVWDLVTLRLLHGFPSPSPRRIIGGGWDAVSGIILERDLLIVSVGSKIMAWKAGPVKAHKPQGKVKTSSKSRNAKWYKRLEMSQDIRESRQAAEDTHTQDQRSHERQRAQLATLGDLGLDEVEALEYVLMLSRDEEEARRVQERESESDDFFAGDFDDIPAAESAPREALVSVHDESFEEVFPTPFPSPPASLRLSPVRSNSNAKIQVSPPLRPEPMEAGFSTSPLGINIAAQRSPPAVGNTEHFPVMSSSVSSRSAGTPVSPSPRMSPSVSWSSLVKSKSSASDGDGTRGHTGPGPGAASGSFTVLPSGPRNAERQRSISSQLSARGPSLLSASLQLHRQSGPPEVDGPQDHRQASLVGDADEDMDADLKLAIELSLADALSRQQLEAAI
ncbi:hypothetical protein DFH11DRAFT_1609389 [Phellopilus nigrolimitatus]|nr:hypothetical protein DFH11DRAFT_1609389 [Phellopilus nigrolimitatus]